MTSPSQEPLLTVRGALVLLLAVLAGVVIGVLTALAGAPVAAAVLAGCGAFGAALPVCQSSIGR